ncbi:MAG: 2,3-butanediol dehydrogenase [Cumulibacter sp.]
MKALQYFGVKDLRLQEVAEPEVRPGWIKMAVTYCGICGSDLHQYVGGTARPIDEPHPHTGISGPVTMGHENLGTITELGEGVTGFEVGQRIVVEALRGCGQCHSCREGMPNVCHVLSILGAALHGGMAPYMVVPADLCHVVPDGISDEVAALTEPLAVGIHAVAQGNVRSGDDVVVFGAGPIGLMTILALKVAGVRRLIVVEPNSLRRSSAERVCADAVIDPTNLDVVVDILERTGGRGADVSFDAAGADASFAAAYSVIRRGGTFVSVSAWERPTEFNPMVLLGTEATFTGALGYGPRDFGFALQLLADGTLGDLSWMVSSIVALDDVVAGGFEELLVNRDAHIKILVRPQG